MKPLLIIFAAYMLTYLGSAWIGDAQQIDVFLREVVLHGNYMTVSPAPRNSAYDNARPPVEAFDIEPDFNPLLTAYEFTPTVIGKPYTFDQPL